MAEPVVQPGFFLSARYAKMEHMSPEESIVLKPREPFADAILLENADELAKFMEQPTTAIAEAMTGAFALGLREWMMSGGRIVQGIVRAKLFQVVGQEIKTLREKGKIPDDFADEKKHKYGFKSWVELLTAIDEAPPDADRLEALKAMFYSVNKVNAGDGEKIVGYQLFQIAKKLTSGQVLYLKASYELFKAGDFQRSKNCSAPEWFAKVGKKLGHQNYLRILKVNRGLLINFQQPGKKPGKTRLDIREVTITDEGNPQS